MVHFEPADETAARGDTAAGGNTAAGGARAVRGGKAVRDNSVAPVAYLPGATNDARNSDADPVELARAALRRLTGSGTGPDSGPLASDVSPTDAPETHAPVTSIATKRKRPLRSISGAVDSAPINDSVPDDGWAKPGDAGLTRASAGSDTDARVAHGTRFGRSDAADADVDADTDTANFGTAGFGTADFDDAAADDEPVEEEFDPVAEREHAETLLLGRLRSRSLSVQEATAVLGATDVTPEDIDEILAHFTELAYLDDNKLADQIIHTHHARKGLGRSGVEAEMRRRKLDPFVIMEKLDELPDEELERATELALTRVRQLSRFDDQTADRRLTAFLQRKGYSSASVRAAVKTALATRLGSGRASTVRFQ